MADARFAIELEVIGTSQKVERSSAAIAHQDPVGNCENEESPSHLSTQPAL